MLPSVAIRLSLCPWLLILPILSLHSSPGPDQMLYGLEVERSCTLSARTARACVQLCDVPLTIPDELPDDAPVRVQCTTRVPVPELGIFHAASDPWRPALRFESADLEFHPAPIAQAERPPVPPPKPLLLT